MLRLFSVCSVKTFKYVKYVLNMFPISFLEEDYRIFNSKILLVYCYYHSLTWLFQINDATFCQYLDR